VAGWVGGRDASIADSHSDIITPASAAETGNVFDLPFGAHAAR
jgi:hypothetical protein